MFARSNFVRTFSQAIRKPHKTFIVTGGASGLGEACVRRLVQSGRNVVICDLNAERGHALADELGKATRFVKTNITSEKDVQAAISEAVSTFGGLNGAVSCAGVGIAKKVLSQKGVHSLDEFANVMNVNLVGTFNVMRLAAAQMASQQQQKKPETHDNDDPDHSAGVLIQTASIAAYDGQIGQAAYASSKAGIVGLTLPMARELAKNRIRVVTIAPGLFNTPLLAGLPEKVRVELGATVPFPSRLGQPSEFAALVEHVIDNNMINGEVIRIDGALRMQP